MASKHNSKKNDDPYIALSNKIEKENLAFLQKQNEKQNQEKKKNLENSKTKKAEKKIDSISDLEQIPDIIVPTETINRPIIKPKQKEEIPIEVAKEILEDIEFSDNEIKTYNPDINLSNKNISGILSILGAEELIFGNLEDEAKNLHIDLDDLEKADIIEEPEITEENFITQDELTNEAEASYEYNLNLGMLEEETPKNNNTEINHQSLLKVIYSIFEKSKNLVALVKNDLIEYMNKNGIGYLEANSPEDVIGKQFFEFVAEKDWNLLAENVGMLLMNEDSLSLSLITMKHQETKAKISAIYIPDEEDFSFILIAEIQPNETAARKVESRQMVYLSDGITGLPSFYVFRDRLQVAVSYRNLKENPSPIATIAINIDNFGELIKSSLSSVTNSLLQQMSNRIAVILRKTNTITRGDKNDFWIMINDLKNEKELEKTLKSLHKSICEDYVVNDETYSITSSLGAAIYPDVAKRHSKLIKLTEEAVKKVKSEGGNNYYIHK